MGPYKKFIVALLAAVAIGLQLFFNVGDGETIFGLDLEAVAGTVIAVLGALGVYEASNDPAPDA